MMVKNGGDGVDVTEEEEGEEEEAEEMAMACLSCLKPKTGGDQADSFLLEFAVPAPFLRRSGRNCRRGRPSDAWMDGEGWVGGWVGLWMDGWMDGIYV